MEKLFENFLLFAAKLSSGDLAFVFIGGLVIFAGGVYVGRKLSAVHSDVHSEVRTAHQTAILALKDAAGAKSDELESLRRGTALLDFEAKSLRTAFQTATGKAMSLQDKCTQLEIQNREFLGAYIGLMACVLATKRLASVMKTVRGTMALATNAKDEVLIARTSRLVEQLQEKQTEGEGLLSRMLSLWKPSGPGGSYALDEWWTGDNAKNKLLVADFLESTSEVDAAIGSVLDRLRELSAAGAAPPKLE